MENIQQRKNKLKKLVENGDIEEEVEIENDAMEIKN